MRNSGPKELIEVAINHRYGHNPKRELSVLIPAGFVAISRPKNSHKMFVLSHSPRLYMMMYYLLISLGDVFV